MGGYLRARPLKRMIHIHLAVNITPPRHVTRGNAVKCCDAAATLQNVAYLRRSHSFLPPLRFFFIHSRDPNPPHSILNLYHTAQHKKPLSPFRSIQISTPLLELNAASTMSTTATQKSPATTPSATTKATSELPVATPVPSSHLHGTSNATKRPLRRHARQRKAMTNVYFTKKGGKTQPIFLMTASTKGLTRYSPVARNNLERSGGSLKASLLRIDIKAAGEKEAGVVLKYLDDNADIHTPAPLSLPVEESLEFYLKVYEVLEKLQFPASLQVVRQNILDWITNTPLSAADIKLVCTTFPAEHAFVRRMLNSIPNLQAQGQISEEGRAAMAAMIGRFPKVEAMNEVLRQKKQKSLQYHARGVPQDHATSSANRTSWKRATGGATTGKKGESLNSTTDKVKRWIEGAELGKAAQSMSKLNIRETTGAKANGHAATGGSKQVCEMKTHE